MNAQATKIQDLKKSSEGCGCQATEEEMLRSLDVVIEGFAKTERFKILEKAFSETGGVQCGFCTPGMIIASESLLNTYPHPSEDEIKIGMSGNLCRCTGYNMIIDAVKLAAKLGDGLW